MSRLIHSPIRAIAFSALALYAAADMSRAGETMRKESFGELDGRAVDLYTLSNASGMEVAITPYGATIVSIRVPDRDGRIADVVLGFESLNGYLGKQPYFGATIGRFANRISRGRLVLDGVEYRLTRNEGENHLHGGSRGFDKVLWDVTSVTGGKEPALALHYLSRDGEEGYPGNLDVTVTYKLTEANELKIDYRATTDKPTVVNLTNHSYFNLAGEGSGDVLEHRLMIDGDRISPVVKGHIPTGEIRGVRGTPFDFTRPFAIGDRIDADDELINLASGYGMNWALNKRGDEMSLAARVFEPVSGRVMEVFTTEPAVQFYSANRLDGTITGKAGKPYGCRHAFCIEPQHYPDSPNRPEFPSTVLRPGEQYHHETVYKFSISR